MRMQITFKSGAQVEVDVSKFTTTTSPLDGNVLTGMKWSTPEDATSKLHHLDMSEVVCIAAVWPNVEVSDGAVPAHDEG